MFKFALALAGMMLQLFALYLLLLIIGDKRELEPSKKEKTLEGHH